jgi:anti-sigma28 factor (negative regulator of flagellin synthesis)
MSYPLNLITQTITAGTQHIQEDTPPLPDSSSMSWWMWVFSVTLLILIAFFVKVVTDKPQTQRSAPPEKDPQSVVGSSNSDSTREPDRTIYMRLTIPISKIKEIKGDISLGELSASLGAQLLASSLTWGSSSESKLPAGVDLNGNTADHDVTFVAECRCICPESIAEKILSASSKTSVATRLKKSSKIELVSLRYGTTDLINIVEGH